MATPNINALMTITLYTKNIQQLVTNLNIQNIIRKLKKKLITFILPAKAINILQLALSFPS